MCGIFAVLSRSAPISQDFTPVLEELRHRGPDDLGGAFVSIRRDNVQVHRRAWLGHTRLSIIDLTAGGHQPMSSADGRYTIVYNGEIYNFKELRDECRAAGARFLTGSDTEVLLRCWELWGQSCLVRLKGMFAFVLIDSISATAILVRDFFGIKPLYIAQTANHIYVASEIGAILRTGNVAASVDPLIAYEYVRFGATASCDRSIVSEIDQLPAGHLIKFDFASGLLQPRELYWSLKQSKRQISFSDAASECRERFFENVRIHLRSDVPVGAALSGGIDSSAIVCAMRIIEPDLDLRTFSYIAAEPSQSEEKWVDLVNRHVGSKGHKVRPQPNDLMRDLDELVRHQGEPFGSASMYAQYCVFKRAREVGVPVTLDGQGADELLGGYWTHVGTFASELLSQRSPFQALRLIAKSAPEWRGSLHIASLVLQSRLSTRGRWIARRLIDRDLFPKYLSRDWFHEQKVDWMRAADNLVGRHNSLKDHLIATVQAGSLPNLLRYADRNSMAFSIESRVPFLTHDFAEFLMSLPSDYLISLSGTRKSVFREAMKGVLPEEIRLRKDKIGFFADDALWIRSNAEYVLSVIDAASSHPLIDRRNAMKFARDFIDGRHNKGMLVWRLLVFGIWLGHVKAHVRLPQEE